MPTSIGMMSLIIFNRLIKLIILLEYSGAAAVSSNMPYRNNLALQVGLMTLFLGGLKTLSRVLQRSGYIQGHSKGNWHPR